MQYYSDYSSWQWKDVDLSGYISALLLFLRVTFLNRHVLAVLPAKRKSSWHEHIITLIFSITTTIAKRPFGDEILTVNVEANNVKLSPAVQVFFGNFPQADKEVKSCKQPALWWIIALLIESSLPYQFYQKIEDYAYVYDMAILL